jgi:hypothetical protein
MLSLSAATYRKIVRASALYDVVVTAPFATPWSFAMLVGVLSSTNQQLGGNPLPPFTPFHTLIACLLGSVVLVWSALRLSDPQQRFGRFDGVARLLFSTWMGWALSVTGAPVLWLFVVPEFAWCVAQFLPVAPGASTGKPAHAARGMGAPDTAPPI